jgi:hypothetical protein
MQRLGVMKKRHVMRHKHEHGVSSDYAMKRWVYTGLQRVHNPERVKLRVEGRQKRDYLLLYLRIIGRGIDRRSLKRVDRGRDRANSEIMTRSM